MDEPTRQRIEACRPGSDDLQSPEMADVAREVRDDPETRLAYQRLQAWDVAISQLLDDVSVPPGLAERILDCLRGAADEPSRAPSANLLAGTVAAASLSQDSTGDVHVAPLTKRAAGTRRRWTGAALSALAAIALVVAVASYFRQGSELPIVDLADQWGGELGNDWQPPADAPRDFALPGFVLVPPARWQWVDRFTTSPVVAYELVHEKAGKAILYVAQMTRGDAPPAPPAKLQSDTGGKAIAYWRSGSNLYVLVLEKESSYRAFVRPSTTPFA